MILRFVYAYIITAASMTLFHLREQGLPCYCTHWFLEVTLDPTNSIFQHLLLTFYFCSSAPNCTFQQSVLCTYVLPNSYLFTPEVISFCCHLHLSENCCGNFFLRHLPAMRWGCWWLSGQIPENVLLINQMNVPLAILSASDRHPVRIDNFQSSCTLLWGFFQGPFLRWWLLKLENHRLLCPEVHPLCLGCPLSKTSGYQCNLNTFNCH